MWNDVFINSTFCILHSAFLHLPPRRPSSANSAVRFFTPLHKFGQKIGIKYICQKCQDSIMCWFTELNTDTFGWFLGFGKVRKSVGFYIAKHRFMHRKALVYSRYLIVLWPLGEATSSVGRLILSKPKNQPKVSGFDIVNQPISTSWFIWFMFFELMLRSR